MLLAYHFDALLEGEELFKSRMIELAPSHFVTFESLYQ